MYKRRLTGEGAGVLREEKDKVKLFILRGGGGIIAQAPHGDIT